MKTRFFIILFTISIFSPTHITGQNLSHQIPTDSCVKIGKLENGITYYIRPNKLPKNRADFYLVQNVGAILEEDDQNGLAHFLEHMAFNGTKHFPNKQLIEYFERIGVKFGANINAYTSLDETVFNLTEVPTIRESTIDSTLLALYDWSCQITLDSSEIESERNVILEEWRTGANAERRSWKELNKIKFKGSKYANRDVIGDTAVINNCSHNRLNDFYKNWYRPDLQCIIVVGDINPAEIEKKIINTFNTIPVLHNPKERSIYSINSNNKTIIAKYSDPEIKTTSISVEYLHDKKDIKFQNSTEAFQLNLINYLISLIIDERFSEIAQSKNKIILGGYGYYGELIKAKDALNFTVVPFADREEKSLYSLFSEIEKIRRYGFSEEEIKRAKAKFTTELDNQFNNKDNRKNGDFIDLYISNYLNQEPIPSIDWEYMNYKTFINSVTPSNLNATLKSYINTPNVIISISYPSNKDKNIPSETEIQSLFEYCKNMHIYQPKSQEKSNQLFEKKLKPGYIKKTSENISLSTKEWTLNNGIKIIIKQTDFKNDEILLNAYSEGGLSKIKKKKSLSSAFFSSQIVENNGIGKHTLIDLNKSLSGKKVQLTSYISTYEEGLKGESSQTDFETLLQMIHLRFTDNRKNTSAFHSLKETYKTITANNNDHRKAFRDSINLWTTQNNPHTIILNKKTLKELKQHEAISIFNKRFQNPADFTFILTGSINPNDSTTKNLICKYIGSLETNNQLETYSDVNIRKPNGILKKQLIRKMEVPKSSNFILYSGSINYNIANIISMRITSEILNLRFIDTIREKEGGTYGVAVRGSIANRPIDEGNLTIQFDTEPTKRDKLTLLIHQEIEKLAMQGPSDSELQKVKENLFKKFEEDKMENDWWASILTRYYHDNIDYYNDYITNIEKVGKNQIKTILNTLISQKNICEFEMTDKK